MKASLAFDSINDLIYMNCCPRFAGHVRKLAAAQGLSFSTSDEEPEGKGVIPPLDPNILIQLFSPLVTSQRFMREQFGNPYTSLQCEDGTTVVFQDYNDHTFLQLSSSEDTSSSSLKRSLSTLVTLVSFICGPDPSLLKTSPRHAHLVDRLFKEWSHLQVGDESFLLEAVSHVRVSRQLGASLVHALQGVVNKVQSQVGDRVQAFLFLGTRVLGECASNNKGVTEGGVVGAKGLMLVNLMCQVVQRDRMVGGSRRVRGGGVRSSIGDSFSRCGGGRRNDGSTSATTTTDDDEKQDEESSTTDCTEDDDDRDDGWQFVGKRRDAGDDDIQDGDALQKYSLLLRPDTNNDQCPSFLPHTAHIGQIQDGLHFVLLSQAPCPLTPLAATLLEQSTTFHRKPRGDVQADKLLFDKLEATTRKLMDALKKHKALHTSLSSKWDRFKHGFQTYVKTKDPLCVQAGPLIEGAREVFQRFFSDSGDGSKKDVLSPLWTQIRGDTEGFWGFLKLKAATTGGSRSSLLIESSAHLNVEKYLEEFPGLVWFVHVDRGQRHRVVGSELDTVGRSSGGGVVRLTRGKISAMVQFAREHLGQGHFSLMWKDRAFHYSYFLWFEEEGTPLRPKQATSTSVSNVTGSGDDSSLPILPGCIFGGGGDFYGRLTSECFPSSSQSSSQSLMGRRNNKRRVGCMELYCVHLGLVTSSCVLEHSKRLATNIFDEYQQQQRSGGVKEGV